MAWKPHPRLITKQQFAEGTTIDGSRLDDAMNDVVTRVNKVPAGDFLQRHTKTQYVAGWTPHDEATYETHHFPWMTYINQESEVFGTTTAPPSGSFVNVMRAKGIEAPGIEPDRKGDGTLDLQGNKHYLWETSFFFHKPAIIDDIRLFLLTSHADATNRVYSRDFKYGSSPPVGFTNGDPTQDMSVSLTVDDEFNRENRSRSHVEAIYTGRKIRFSTVTMLKQPAASVTDMVPSGHFDGLPHGIMIAMEDLNIPLHQDSRARITVSIPCYSSSNVSDWPQDAPWRAGNFTLVLTALEEISG